MQDKYKIRFDLAVEAAGNKAELARRLGITRQAVNLWRDRHRSSPFIPELSARRFCDDRLLLRRYRELENQRGKTKKA